MKSHYLIIGLTAFALMSFKPLKKDNMKKVQTFSTSINMQLPATKIWDIISNNFGEVQNYADQIQSSNYINGHTNGGENCERVCYLDKEKSNYYIEKMINVDTLNLSYTIVMTDVGKLPVVPGLSKAHFRVNALTDSTCQVFVNSEYRTKPAFLGVLFKRKFKSTMDDYLISIDYYAKTGTPVNKENFKTIKKDYLTANQK